MVTEQTFALAREVIADLRRSGDREHADAIEALVQALGGTVPLMHELPARAELPDLFGADGQTVRRWVQEGKYPAYRIGRFVVPKDIAEEYVRLAGESLELDEVTDEEAARLVAEGRRQDPRGESVTVL